MLRHVFFFILLGGLTPLWAEHWAAEPLGPAVEASAPSAVPYKRELKTRYRRFPAEGPTLRLVQEGTPLAVIVVPARAAKGVGEAAVMLQTTVHEISGASLPVLREDQVSVSEEGVIDPEGKVWTGAVWLGLTQRAAAEGIRDDDLRPEGYLLRSKGSFLFIVGRDANEDGLPVNGTRHGVVSLLERHLGVRWLWPGEQGTVMPRRSTLELPALHEQDEPAIVQRILRNSGRVNSKEEIGLRLLKEEGARERYLETKRQTGQWLARQRTGSSVRLAYGHAYEGIYEKYGKEHPGWFALQPDGTRVQFDARARLCKSNPELAKAIARDILERKAKFPGQRYFSISPNDGGSRDFFCMCEACRRLDPVNGEKVKLLFASGEKRVERFYVSYPSLTDRTVTFYNRIAEATGDADLRLGAYAYSAYRNPPLSARLHPKILIGFVGLGYFDEAQRKADLKRWDGWCVTANELFLRPNLLSGGAGLPSVYVQRLAADLKHCYRTGMVAGDFDTFIGNWSTQGLNYYVLARLLWDPSLEVDAMVEDYCRAGFGKAAPLIGRYFGRLEEATLALANAVSSTRQARIEEQLREEEDETTSPKHNAITDFGKAVRAVYTPELLGELRTILKEAAEAESDVEVRERIAFLNLGLDYADLEIALYRDDSSFAESQPLREEMLAFHRNLNATSPLAVNSVYRLYWGVRLFRNLP